MQPHMNLMRSPGWLFQCDLPLWLAAGPDNTSTMSSRVSTTPALPAVISNWLLSHRSVAISATEAAFQIGSGFIKLFLDLDNNIISRFVVALLDWHAASLFAGRSRTGGKCTTITQTVGFWSIPKNVQQSPTTHIISSEYSVSQLNTRKLQQTNKKFGTPNLCMYRGSDLNLSHIPGHPVRELSQTRLWYQIRN